MSRRAPTTLVQLFLPPPAYRALVRVVPTLPQFLPELIGGSEKEPRAESRELRAESRERGGADLTNSLPR